MHQHRQTLVFDKFKRKLRRRDINPHLGKNNLSKSTASLLNFSKVKYFAYGLPVVCMISLLGILSYSFSVGTVFNYAEDAYALDGEDNTTTSPDPTAKITITAGDGEHAADQNAATLVTKNGMAYRSHEVTVDVNDITKYSLQLSYASGKDNLRLEGSNAYLMGADGRTPANMPDNTWGFAWGTNKADDGNIDSFDTADEQMTYYTVPQFGSVASELSNGLLASNDVYQDSFKGKLVFGAKFGDNATSGHYKTQVILSLTANAKEVVTTLDDIFQMQQMTPEICASSVIGEHSTLQDVRDGSAYLVQRLEDGNCWMTQNLKLTKESIESWKSTHPDNDNNVQLSNKYSNVASSSTYALPTSYTSKSQWTSTSTTLDATLTSENTDYGTYYSWCAATAGSCSNATSDGQAALYSICPKGWRLPGGGSTVNSAQYGYSYNKLVADAGFTNDAAGSAKLIGEPYNFQYAGRVNNGSIDLLGSNGLYWSNTAYSGTNAYSLNFNNSSVGASYKDYYRYSGRSVRCVAPSLSIELINTMQEMTPEICKSTPVGYSKALIDTRGAGYTNYGTPNSYVISKLSDGNCWMLQNLSLTAESLKSATGTTKLTKDNSDVSNDYDLAGSTVNTSHNTDTIFGKEAGYLKSQICDPGLVDNRKKGFGAYYSWHAATAGTSVDEGEAPNSICPKGWRLPTSGKSVDVDGSFNKLSTKRETEALTKYTNTKLALTDVYGYTLSDGLFFAAGFMYVGNIYYATSSGFYWSSTAVSDTKAYNLGFSWDTFYPSGSRERYYGATVRCIAPAS